MSRSANKHAAIQKAIEQFLREIDSYRATLQAIICFGHEICWNNDAHAKYDGANFWPGRRMITSSENEISPNEEITPDLIIKRNSTYGVVAEVKNGLPIDKELWDTTIDQLIKYDDCLSGWNGDKSDGFLHDIVLLIPNHLRVEFDDYCLSKFSSQNPFIRNFSAVSFHREDRANIFLSLCKFYGDLLDQKKSENLRKIVQVPMQRVIPHYTMNFCDEKPPIPYTMDIVWKFIVNYKFDLVDAEDDKKQIFIKFTIDRLVSDLRNENCCWPQDAQSPLLPKTDWIREAITELLKSKFLLQDSKKEYYMVSYSKYERLKNPLEKFLIKVATRQQKKKKNPSQKQLLLP